MNGSLDEKIEQVRIEMIQTVERLGMTSKETIEISQKLDELINQSIHQKNTAKW
ncbi:aspartyl-phosphate phosphatase Spo0E family protein [Sporosarcina sp. FSL W7-1349]|uniref:aspartyl-phosphate phosphatase Spo0E family protein n=1 Tax=Sporosarcina sp. FSL W7-1349 TaxID=2921561 RepID=UPI0030F70C3E